MNLTGKQLAVIGLILVVLYLFASRNDLNDAERQEEIYCYNVANGTWPDYQSLKDSACKKYANN